MKRVAAPIPFAGSELGKASHVCALFNSDDEEYRVLHPFIKDCGDKAMHVVNADQHGAHLRRLATAGSNPETDIRRTHPMVITGGMLQQNPFFVSPDVFLRELRERRVARSTASRTAN